MLPQLYILFRTTTKCCVAYLHFVCSDKALQKSQGHNISVASIQNVFCIMRWDWQWCSWQWLWLQWSSWPWIMTRALVKEILLTRMLTILFTPALVVVILLFPDVVQWSSWPWFHCSDPPDPGFGYSDVPNKLALVDLSRYFLQIITDVS